MERKSIGQFICALRKANGMTQKQLADMLCVSDKAVSRWERDECAPDINLIPVIAEIFGVTSDEILRGERTNAEKQDFEATGLKSKKRLDNIINAAKTKFTVRSMISLGIAVVGLIFALTMNFGFYKARVGFFIGCAFFLTAILLEAVFTVLANSSAGSDELDGESIGSFKKFLFRNCSLTVSGILCIFSSTLPFAFLVSDAYEGLILQAWLQYVAFFVGFCAFLCLAAYWVAEQMLLKKGEANFSEYEKAKLKLKKRYIFMSAIVLIATLLVQIIFVSSTPDDAFAKKKTFNSTEEFIEYMETPTPLPDADSASMTAFVTEPPVYTENTEKIDEVLDAKEKHAKEYTIGSDDVSEPVSISTAEEYFEKDEYGYIWEDEFETNEGTIKFMHRNRAVISYGYNELNGTFDTITHSEYQKSRTIFRVINICYAFLYIIEIIIAIKKYRSAVKKIKV